jgi:hypothetical protein
MYFNISSKFIAGACNGVSQTIVGHPLDTIKILQQNNSNWKKFNLI